MTTQTKFKSSATEKRWIELHKEKQELQKKPSTAAIEEKIDVINSLMTACKTGFNLSEAKIKKAIKFLKEKTGNKKIKYGTLPAEIKPHSVLFKETVILYAEKDEQILFKEHE